MLFVSSLIDLIHRHTGPRTRFEIDQWRAARYGQVEREWWMLADYVDRARAAVDVGAHGGVYAGRLARLSPRVHCFEPLPWLADALRRALPRRAVVHQMALSDVRGTAALHVPVTPQGAELGLATLRALPPAEASTARVVQVPLERMDDVLTEPVGFIKIDVEGHEMPVLRGAGRIIEHDRPSFLIESEARHAEGAPLALFAFMAERDYRGSFHDGTTLRDVAEFVPTRHQQVDPAGYPRPGYVNNFFFVPRGRAG